MYDDLMAMTKKDLLERARTEGLAVNARMSKDDIVRRLMRNEGRRRENEWCDKNFHKTI